MDYSKAITVQRSLCPFEGSLECGEQSVTFDGVTRPALFMIAEINASVFNIATWLLKT